MPDRVQRRVTGFQAGRGRRTDRLESSTSSCRAMVASTLSLTSSCRPKRSTRGRSYCSALIEARIAVSVRCTAMQMRLSARRMLPETVKSRADRGAKPVAVRCGVWPEGNVVQPDDRQTAKPGQTVGDVLGDAVAENCWPGSPPRSVNGSTASTGAAFDTGFGTGRGESSGKHRGCGPAFW